MLISLDIFNKLIIKQNQLDRKILEKINLNQETNLPYKRRFALLTEIIEFANEVRWFKYWSQKKSDNHKIKEELIDVIHFALSITQEYIDQKKLTIEKYYYLIKELPLNINDKNIGQIFFKFVNLASDHQSSILNIWSYIDVFNRHIFIDENELLKYYNIKNKINHNRQITNY